MKTWRQAILALIYSKLGVLGTILLTGLLWHTEVFAQAGALDCDFGNGGIVTTAFTSDKADYAQAIAIYNSGTYNGRIVAVGSAKNASDDEEFAIARYNADGSLDTSFSGDGKQTINFGYTYEKALSVAIQTDDKIVVVGHCENSGQYAKLAIARLNADGSLDTTFSGDGKDVQDLSSSGFSGFYGNGVAIDGSGIIWIAGAVDNDSKIVKYAANGTYQTMYSRNLGSNNESFADILVDANQKLVVVGSDGGQPNRRWTVLRVNSSDGTNDSTFNSGAALYIDPSPVDGIDYANAVALSGAQIVVGGKAGGADFGVARVNADGTLDTTFSGDGIATVDVDGETSDQPTGVVVQSDGKIIIGSYANYKYGFARFNTYGSLDTFFDGDGKVTYSTGSVGGDYPYAMEIQPDGKVVSAGTAWTQSGDAGKDFGVIRIRTQSANMAYLSATTTQNNTGAIAPGAEGEIIGIEVKVCGDLTPFAVTQLNFNTTGTTNTGDLVSAKVYYTGTSNAFATGTQFGSTVNAPSGSFNVTGSQTLQPGTNYFWLAYTVSASATQGNLVDAQCTQVTLSGGVGAQTPTVTNPVGTREIKSIVFSEDFGTPACSFPSDWTSIDSDADGKNWTTDNDGNGGEPNGRTGCGIRSASWDGVVLTPNNWLVTPAIDLSSYSAATARYYIASISTDASYDEEKVTLYLSTSGNTVADFTGANGHQLDTYTTLSSDWVERGSISLNAYVGQTVYLAWRHYESTDQWAVRLDDILVTGVPVPANAAPTTSTVTANNVTQANAGQTSYTFTVTYTDDSAVDVSTINTSDVTVTGCTVTGANEPSGVDGTPKTATYTITPPGGSWNDSDNGTYTIGMVGSQVGDNGSPQLFVAANAALATFTVTMDTTAPVLNSFIRQSPGSNPTNADTLVFRATFNENVQNVDAADFTVTGTTATVTGVAVFTANTVYDLTVSGGDLAGLNGTVGLNLAGGQNITDTAGNALAGEPGTNQTYTLDNDAPGLTSFVRQTPAASPTNADTLVFRATFDENVQNVDAADFTVTGTTATVTGVAVVTADTVYDVTVSGGDLAGLNGTVGINLAAGQNIADLAGNALPAGEPGTNQTYTLDNDAPTVTINQADGQADPATSAPIDFTVVFNETVTGFDNAADVALSGTANPSTAVITGAGPTYNVAISGMTSMGTVIANILAGVAQDSAGNNNAAATFTDNQVQFNPPPPSVASINRADASPTNAASVDFTVTFSQSVSGIDTGDFSLALSGTTGSIASVSAGSGTTVTVTVNSITGDGTLGLNLVDDDSIVNALSVPLGGVGTGNGNFTGQVYTIDRVAPTVVNVTSPTANGTYYIGDVIDVTVRFTEIVTVTGGTPLLTLETGTSDSTVEYSSGSDSDTLTFVYTVLQGHTSPDLDYLATTALSAGGGTIRDAVGNNASLTLPSPGTPNSLGANKALVINGTPRLAINEIDYNQGATDNAEFIEIKNVSAAAVTLGGYAVRLVNDNAGTPSVYQTINLNAVSLAAGDYYVLCNTMSTTVGNCDQSVSLGNDFIQDGSPDALELAKGIAVVDSVSYDGNTPGYTETAGAPADNGAEQFVGLSRYPDGQDNNDNSLDFSLRCITPGGANTLAGASGCFQVSINDPPAVNEGNDGTTTPLVFTVSLSHAATSDVTVTYATSDYTATTSDGDYADTTGTVTFLAGSNTDQTITVTVNGDDVDEPTETFYVNVSNPGTNAVITTDRGTGTITDDDVAGFTVTPISLTVSEPSGTNTFTITLTSRPAGGASVTIPLTSSNPSVCTVAPASVTIANAAWNTGAAATVTAVDDSLDNPGDQRTCTVQTGDPSSADAAYNAMTAGDVADVAVTVRDNENMEISIREKVSGTEIPHRGTYNLGTVGAGAFMLLEFTITNTGTIDLLLTGSPELVALSGPQVGDFQVVLPPTSPVPAGGSKEFILLFDCGGDDPRSVTVTIANNDSDEAPYVFTIVANQPAQPNSYLLWTQ